MRPCHPVISQSSRVLAMKLSTSRAIVASNNQDGMMLLEALIAILVFSVGILGMVSLQAISIKSSADAVFRSEASHLANQIIGQMWVDKDNLQQYALNAGATACSAGSSTSGNSSVQGWIADASRLPGGDSVLHQILVGAGGVVTVTVCWLPPRATRPHNFIASTAIN